MSSDYTLEERELMSDWHVVGLPRELELIILRMARNAQNFMEHLQEVAFAPLIGPLPAPVVPLPRNILRRQYAREAREDFLRNVTRPFSQRRALVYNMGM